MRREIEDYVRTCQNCQFRKGPNRRGKPPLKPLEIVGPYERLVIDTMGPLKKSASGNKHVMVVTDWFTKWVEIVPLPDITASSVARVLVEEVICRYGAPREILSDRGSDFTTSLFRAVCRQCNTVKV